VTDERERVREMLNKFAETGGNLEDVILAYSENLTQRIVFLEKELEERERMWLS
jgi:hypothetical protein